MDAPEADLRGRSIRTLAWLGDARFELEVRARLAARGDYPTDRLDKARAKVVCAEGQAALLDAVEPSLDEREASVVRRARNAAVRGGGRAARDTRAYRNATAFEALVAWWSLDASDWKRFSDLLETPLARALDEAVRASQAPQ